MSVSLIFAFILWTAGIVLVFTGARRLIQERRARLQRESAPLPSEKSGDSPSSDA